LEDSLHGGVQRLVRDLNQVYGPENALWEADGEPAGFEWIDVDNAPENIVAFMRRSPKTGREIVCVSNFSALPKKGYRLKLPQNGEWEALIDTDAEVYGGNKSVEVIRLKIEDIYGEIELPALTTLWFAPRQRAKRKPHRSKKSRTKR